MTTQTRAEASPSVGPIFIFATGQRCGSTLLQRFLCSHPQIMIWGEQDGTLEKILGQFDRLVKWEKMFHFHLDMFLNDGPNNFIANMTPLPPYLHNAQVQLIRDLWQLPAQELGRPIWGFKEVLYEAPMALRLRTLFPTARVIHMTRSITACIISLLHEERLSGQRAAEIAMPPEEIWSRQRTLEARDKWVKINRSFVETPGLRPDWVFHVTYEQLTTNMLDTTQQLIDWLGLDARDFDRGVFDHKIYTDRHKGPDTRPKRTVADLSADELALITDPEALEVSRLLNYDLSEIPV